VVKDGKVLLGKRRNAHGEGAWSFPGGHLEYGETWEECARREVFEETGMQIASVRFAAATNDVFGEAEKHYVTIFMIADWAEGTPEPCEPEKCERWEWYAWDALPEPRFLPLQHLVDQGFSPLT
ncbi:NUDIX domain-containing protein, partial [Candidatus Uhrbacteria bacterium]|nr:NUDIX domain-containing protein [Candidatus Uhrbacteria bacterium]